MLSVQIDLKLIEHSFKPSIFNYNDPKSQKNLKSKKNEKPKTLSSGQPRNAMRQTMINRHTIRNHTALAQSRRNGKETAECDWNRQENIRSMRDSRPVSDAIAAPQLNSLLQRSE
jgi:hypothetical protein